MTVTVHAVLLRFKFGLLFNIYCLIIKDQRTRKSQTDLYEI